jgi:CBS domain-containing protein
MKASDVMTTAVVTIAPETNVRHIAQLMLRHRVSALPVVDDAGKLVGIVSEGDLMQRTELGARPHTSWWLRLISGSENIAEQYVKHAGQRAKDVMTKEIIWVDERTPLSSIAAILEEKRIKRVPVVKEGMMVGIVSRADLLHAIAAAKLDDTAPGDSAIRRAVQTRIRENSGAPESMVNVTVTDGVVHLWGIVDSPAERRAAEIAADSVRGVSAVVDHTSIFQKSFSAPIEQCRPEAIPLAPVPISVPSSARHGSDALSRARNPSSERKI